MDTIDGGVEDGMKAAADNVEPEKESDGRERDGHDESPEGTHWWVLSTASPLLAGTFGPMATAFSICALSSVWRVYIPPGESELDAEPIPDSGWEVVLNVVSLVCALTGNIFLLLNMARRVSFAIAQPVAISGFFLGGTFLIVDMAVLASGRHDRIHEAGARPDVAHALAGAFYYAIFAAAIYVLIGILLCSTAWGALKGCYGRDFLLTLPQRTLMMQTMSFVTYLLLGALIFSYIEGWPYLDAVYWADVTLLTVGLGDFAPTSTLARALLMPFALGGILMLALVVSSIRSLVLDHGEQKLSARLAEQRRSSAAHDVDDRRRTVRISVFAQVDFSIDPALSPAQRRHEEFLVMRRVQDTVARERRCIALATSLAFVVALWLVGAAVFLECEGGLQDWTYFDAVYFAYVVLLTIGYGDLVPKSGSGRAFFVVWSLLAVPTLTILISHLGDTVVRWFADATIWIGSMTILPGEKGWTGSLEVVLAKVRSVFGSTHWPRALRGRPVQHMPRMDAARYDQLMRDQLAARLGRHLSGSDEVGGHGGGSDDAQDQLFYSYVLARECSDLWKCLATSPPKMYSWSEWEYYLRLMGGQSTRADVPPRARIRGGFDVPENGSRDGEINAGGLDGNVERRTSIAQRLAAGRRNDRQRARPDLEPGPGYLARWSWLSNASPLMSRQSECEWILESISAALEGELEALRRGMVRRPPVGLRDAAMPRSGDSRHGHSV